MKSAMFAKRGSMRRMTRVLSVSVRPKKGAYIMTALIWLMGLAFSMFLQGISTAVIAQDAILPQGDTRLQTVEQESPRAQEARNARLKRQGQGSNYRVDGLSQLVADRSSGGTGATSQENTGLSDPSVNPGQAAGTKTFRGRVLKSENNIHTIRLRNGKQADIEIDANTTGDKDVQVGDRISGKLTPQGRAITIHIDKPAKKR
jgi:hypothetical protein